MDVESCFTLGNEYLNRNENEKAIECFDKTLEINPEHIQALNNKGVALLNLGDFKKAIESFEIVLEINPDELDVILRKGFALLNLGERRKSIDCFEDILKINPEDIGALYYKGVALKDLEKYKEALKCFEEILKIDSEEINAILEKAICLYAIKKPKKALETIETAIKIEPENAEAWDYKGYILTGTKDENEAMDAFNTALNINPNFDEAWVDKGKLYDQIKDFKKAIECFDKAIGIDLNSTDAWFEKANILRKIGNEKDSIKAYKKFVEVGKDVIDDQVMVRRVRWFLKNGPMKKTVTFSPHENPQYWQWITHSEHFLNADGTEADWLEPEPKLEFVPGNWWGGAHKDTVLGDLILLYRAGKGKKYSDIKYLIQAESDAYLTLDVAFAAKNGWKYGIDYKPIYKFKNPLTYEEINKDPYLKDWNARRANFQRSVYKTEPQYWKRLLELLSKKNPDFKEFLKEFDPKKIIDKIIVEKDFENHLAKNISILKKFGYDLELIRQQQICELQGGFIDLYCKDKSNDGYVVIELKIVRADRETYGQISEYMGWVKTYKAHGKPVNGIVISKGCNKSFSSALQINEDIKHIDLREILNELGLELK